MNITNVIRQSVRGKSLILCIIMIFVSSLAYCVSLDERFTGIDDLFKKGNYSGALEDCREILAIAPGDTRTYAYLGYCQLLMGNNEDAAQSLQKAISIDPANEWALTSLTSAYTNTRRYDLAWRYGKKAIKLDPSDPYGYYVLGYAYYKAKSYNPAIEYFERSISLDNKKPEAWFYLGYSYFQKGLYVKARDNFEETIKRSSGGWYVSSAKKGMADSYFREKKYHLAIEVYSDIVKNHDGDTKIDRVLFLRASAYFYMEDYKNVIKFLNEFIKQYPESDLAERAQSLLAVAYGKEGMPHKSLDALNKAGVSYMRNIITLVVLIIAAILVFIVAVFFLGKLFMRKTAVSLQGTAHHVFNIKHAILIAVMQIFVPLVLTIIAGKILFGQPLIGFLPPDKSIKTVYTFCAAYIAGNIFLACLAVWFCVKKYDLSKKELGFIRVGAKPTVLFPILVVAILVVLSIAYENIIEGIFNIKIPVQIITTIVKSINTLGMGIAVFATIVIVAPVCEELIFRVFFYNAFKKRAGVKRGIIFSALFFAVLHFELWSMLLVFIMGIALAYLYEKTKSIIPCIIAHILNNLLYFILVYFFPDL